jgi:gas vesicle protein
MNGIQALDLSWTGLVGGTRTAVKCFSGRGGVLDCQPVWTGLIIGIVVIAAIAMLFVLRKLIGDYLRHRAAISRWKAEQAIAPDEEMSKAKWRGDESEAETRSQQELAEQIKEALKRNQKESKEA